MSVFNNLHHTQIYEKLPRNEARSEEHPERTNGEHRSIFSVASGWCRLSTLDDLEPTLSHLSIHPENFETGVKARLSQL